MSIEAKDLVWRVGRKLVVDHVSLRVEPGSIVGLIGPNGSGKSSLLRILAGLRRADEGRVTLDDDDMSRIPRRSLAQRIAFVQQDSTTQLNVTVLDVVRLGRTPHRRPLSGWTRHDLEAVEHALRQVEMWDRRGQFWQSLSGGERQRVHIARALAQDPTELLLDEPTNHLDIQHQLDLLHLIRHLGKTCIVALHDLNHAALFCDRLVVLQDGRVAAAGTPRDVLTRDVLGDVFRVDCDYHHPGDGTFHMLLRRRSNCQQRAGAY